MLPTTLPELPCLRSSYYIQPVEDSSKNLRAGERRPRYSLLSSLSSNPSFMPVSLTGWYLLWGNRNGKIWSLETSPYHSSLTPAHTSVNRPSFNPQELTLWLSHLFPAGNLMDTLTHHSSWFGLYPLRSCRRDKNEFSGFVWAQIIMIEIWLLILPVGEKEAQSRTGQSRITEKVTKWNEDSGLLSPQPHGPIDNSFSLLLESACVLLLTCVMSLVSDNIANHFREKYWHIF